MKAKTNLVILALGLGLTVPVLANDEHMHSLHEGMEMAKGMMSGMDMEHCPMMKGMMGGKGMDGAGKSFGGHEERVDRMEKRMDMMEQMMKGGASRP